MYSEEGQWSWEMGHGASSARNVDAGTGQERRRRPVNDGRWRRSMRRLPMPGRRKLAAGSAEAVDHGPFGVQEAALWRLTVCLLVDYLID